MNIFSAVRSSIHFLPFGSCAFYTPSTGFLSKYLCKQYFSQSSRNFSAFPRLPLHIQGSSKVLKSSAVQSIRRSIVLAKSQIAEIPSQASKWVGYWLIGCSGMVVGSVILGGVTRLTKSGLSMVDWHLFKEFPPLTDEQWNAEFIKYQDYPEYKQKGKEMSLKDFKWIWYMEYCHRMWGRAVGAFFLLPAIYLWRKKWFTSGMKKRVPIFGALILFQGLLGWYMVKSGLADKNEPDGVARVSQYRLAAHLGTAFVLYSLLLWSGLNHLLPPQEVSVTTKLRKFMRYAHGMKFLIFITAFSGAFVAGIEAGLIYNTFPKMGDLWIPSDIAGYSPRWRNMTENPTTVQFDHRLLGESVLCAVTTLWLNSRSVNLPPRAKLAVNCMLALAVLQVTLGILTLLQNVPKPLAASHQAGALALLSSAIWLTHELKFIRWFPK